MTATIDPIIAPDAAVPFDEGVEPSGAPRAHYAPLLRELDEARLGALARDVQADMDALGIRFGGRRFPVDPVPRLLSASEWTRVERGIAQRVRALNAFIADAYSDRRIVAAGVLPARVIEESEHYEPLLRTLPVPPRAAVAGLDLVRDPSGELRSLEDNLRTPSGLSFLIPARAAIASRVGAAYDPAGVDSAIEEMGATLRAADPSATGDPSIALVCDGPTASAWFEHRDLATRLGVPLLTPDRLYVSRGRLRAWAGDRSLEIGVLYRRTDEERLSGPDGRPTGLGELLIGPLRRGALSCVNSFGAGLADDKAIHAYSDALIEFYLGEAPELPSVRAYDLGRPEHLDDALERLDELVVKGRGGSGGEEVRIAGELGSRDLEAVAARIRRAPARFIAQERVTLSVHPTVADGRLAPRHVDLRPFGFAPEGGSVRVVPGGFTRFAPTPGDMVVNTAQGGGGKDTWVLRDEVGAGS
jgi:uncharacterized circularly permuted ATP-grasp superfamily protein